MKKPVAVAVHAYPPAEELANSLTHGVGALLSVAGLAILVTLAALRADAWAVSSAAVFGASLVLLYTASTLYHTWPGAAAKQALRRLDHAAIFVLIAGTYTPFMLVNLRGPWGWSLFGVVWGAAAVGVALKVWFTGRFELLSTAIYVALGWLVVIAVRPMLREVPPASLWLLLAGGLAYTLGTVFYLWDRLRFNHAVWHVWVLAGSICHYFAVLRAIVPPSGI